MKTFRAVYFITIAIVFLSGCGSTFLQPVTESPSLSLTPSLPTQSPSPTQKQPTATVTITATPTWTTSPTPFGWFSGIDSLLPEECSKREDQIVSSEYERYYFYRGACKNPVLSPDGSMMAYVLAVKNENSDRTPELSQVVKLLILRQSFSIEIYQLHLYDIMNVSWSSDGKLVILDGPIEGSWGNIVIYDPIQKTVVDIFQTNYYVWNSQRTAFFAIQSLSGYDYGPDCANTIVGYDFVHNIDFPDLMNVNERGDFILSTDEPLWSADGLHLVVTMRAGQGKCADYDSIYGPSFIVELDFSGLVPKLKQLFSNPTLDYSIQRLGNGDYKVISTSYSPKNCMELFH